MLHMQRRACSCCRAPLGRWGFDPGLLLPTFCAVQAASMLRDRVSDLKEVDLAVGASVAEVRCALCMLSPLRMLASPQTCFACCDARAQRRACQIHCCLSRRLRATLCTPARNPV